MNDIFRPNGDEIPDDEREIFDPESRTLSIITDDGGVDIYENVRDEDDYNILTGHNENLAESLSDDELSSIAAQLIREIDQDEASRSEWMHQRKKGLDLLGIKIEQPRSDIGSSSAPVEGMSNVYNPLLLEACVRFQAETRGELLPPGGPVKVKNTGAQVDENDEQADALQKELNSYLTDTCDEYYPDTDRLIFGVGWSGAGFKKGYHCPIRRRPVIESVDAKDLIISNDATDIQSAHRVTHRFHLAPADMKRMMVVGAYVDVELGTPNDTRDAVETAIARKQGIDIQTKLPEDYEHLIYECYCDLDIPGHEHKKDGKATGLPLPYKVTIDETSRKILEIRRNWDEDDENCIKRRTFVLYPFIPMFGFYPSGFLHILGNTNLALTAAWREFLDAGMFANFPGFLKVKGDDRQLTNSFRVPPGGSAEVDIGQTSDIRSAIMPLPYKEPGPASVAFVSQIENTGRRLGGTADAATGDMNANAPVGTTLAILEQQSRPRTAVHGRLVTAQAEEFKMLRKLLQEDPGALMRHRKGQPKWNEDQIVAALENYDIVPVADPETPTQMHRIIKTQTLRQFAMSAPQGMYDIRKIDLYCMKVMGIEHGEQFLLPPASPNPLAMIMQNPIAIKAIQEYLTGHEKNQIAIAQMESKERSHADDQEVKRLKLLVDAYNAETDRAANADLERIRLSERVAKYAHEASNVQ